jgi:hypothetical protein
MKALVMRELPLAWRGLLSHNNRLGKRNREIGNSHNYLSFCRHRTQLFRLRALI